MQVICKYYTFYIRDLNIWGFWYLWGVLEPILHGYRGMTVVKLTVQGLMPLTLMCSSVNCSIFPHLSAYLKISLLFFKLSLLCLGSNISVYIGVFLLYIFISDFILFLYLFVTTSRLSALQSTRCDKQVYTILILKI